LSDELPSFATLMKTLRALCGALCAAAALAFGASLIFEVMSRM
jgi:hypothetical protein